MRGVSLPVMKPFAALLLILVLSLPLAARVDFLLLPPAESPATGVGQELVLCVDNPTADPDDDVRLPGTIVGTYATATTRGTVRLSAVAPGAGVELPRSSVLLKLPAMTSQRVTLRLVDALPATDGFVSLRLSEPATNAVMFRLAKGEPVTAAASYTALPATAKDQTKNKTENVDLRSDVEGVRRHISGYDPIYFAVGARTVINARFQFSFKYRVVEPRPETDWLRDLYIAYTQTSIWDLESVSKPFYDSSYKPTAFFLRERLSETGPWSFVGLQAGVQHESNGRGLGNAPTQFGGLIAVPKHPNDTRSLNSVYFAPKVRWSDQQSGWFLEAKTRVIGYMQMNENPDLPNYRGHVELTLRGGADRGFQMAVNLRGSPRHGRGSAEFNATWPVTEVRLLRWLMSPDLLHSIGGYAQIQYFNGYGESLLDYDVRRKDQLRFGLEIVR